MSNKQVQESIRVLQNILNSMDAYLYVSDIETDEILFINDKMKEHFNLSDDAVGQTCWKVLQSGFSERCEFCPNRKLIYAPDEVISWEENNTVTGRYYRNVDRFIEWTNGKVHLQHSTDITELKISEQRLKRRLEQQELMVRINRNFISDDNIDTKVKNALRLSGEFMGISRTLLISIENDTFTFKNEWCNPSDNIKSVVGTTFNTDKDLNDILVLFESKEADHFELGDCDYDADTAITMYNLDLKNLILFPIYVRDKLWGILEFDQCTKFVPWSENDMNLGHVITGVLSVAISKSETEEQLKRMSSIVEHAPQYISFINAEGRFEYVNPAITQITGYEKEELYEHGFSLFFSQMETDIKFGNMIDEVIKNGKVSFELPIIRKDGAKRLMSFSTFMLGEENKGIGAIATDVTEVRRLEKALISAKEQAEKSSKAKGEFLSNMSHEMRTPLNAVIGMTNIARKTDDYNRKEYCLEKINDASSHLLGVINDILDMSKIEANKLEISKANFDFDSMIANVVNVISFRIEEKKQNLFVEIAPGIPKIVYADQQRIAQVITNLLSNAVKFTPKKGNIEFSVELIGETDEKVSIFVKVKDDGIGISEEQKNRLFRSFEQADGGISRKFGGTGLGLAISKSIVELMGGKIGVESEFGNGAAFYFNIDIEKVNQEKDGDEGRQAYDRLEGIFKDKTILLAEDISINQEIVIALLDETRVNIDVANNGKEAIEKFNENYDRYDLILMDIQMPEIDGLEASRLIRKMDIPKAKSIPIIAMTANAFQEDVERCMNSGMNAHVRKPIDFDLLINTLIKFMKD